MFLKTMLSIAVSLFFTFLSVDATAGRAIKDSYQSTVLGRKVEFTVYLPDEYARTAGKLSAIYLLHGLDGDQNEWLENGTIGIFNTLVKKGVLQPRVVIMPSFGPQSWWVDGAADKAETALMQELMPHVESKYRLLSDRAGRAVAGWSMGGYGALNLAMKYPDRFCGAAVVAPEIYDPLPAETSAIRRMPQFMTDQAFDPAEWQALNYTARLNAYRSSSIKVPIWIVTGDDDALLGLVPMAAQLYGRLLEIQPGQSELRVINGELDWATVRNALPNALRYINRKCQSDAHRNAAIRTLKHTVAQADALQHPPVRGR
ncbi:alpha/beta hydrolase [Noviherbaspirillum suwonense]|jgi:enterochelin esterase-like enzyme|uniref:S-formylglutathione hydrolase FrmB n=1 Tax=Noviherbaspirillum suwonense TaxID=1224511 RepID=A0ABY1PTY1_9BURK|nr:alpha/beta hydrolase-fold protein [Noviherbaspirillum suwonense]SMP45875.1 S-formylglutathione hydrolase FrmB [Noviherbaspirillum suwonense]